MFGEKQYLAMVKHIINSGARQVGRNGSTRVSIGHMMKFSLKNNKLPLITTKKLAWKTCLKELIWFVRGQTDNRILKNQNVKIWNGNGSREFLDSRGLNHLREDDLGPVYGHQWRHFNAKYSNSDEDYSGKGIDQLNDIINQLRNFDTRYSRRLIMTAWNPLQINEMALPPCHVMCQFHLVGQNKLSCSLYQRSGDVGLGIPFNIASYSFLTHLIAHHCDLKADKFIHFIGNAHIYEDHVESLSMQTLRDPYDPPSVYIKNKYDDINDYDIDDFEVKDYKSFKKINMDMRV